MRLGDARLELNGEIRFPRWRNGEAVAEYNDLLRGSHDPTTLGLVEGVHSGPGVGKGIGLWGFALWASARFSFGDLQGSLRDAFAVHQASPILIVPGYLLRTTRRRR
jgi:hypothetical protein